MKLPWQRRLPDWSADLRPPTPYERARDAWNDRMGSAEKRGRNWRAACCGSLLVSSLLVVEVMRLADRVTVYPYVVEVNETGQVRTVGQIPQQPYTPSQDVLKSMVAQWLQDVRNLTLDPVVEQRKWWRAYDFITGSAATLLNDYVKEVEPVKHIGHMTAIIEIETVLALSERAFQVNWTETVVDIEQQRKATSKYSGIFHTVVVPWATLPAKRREPRKMLNNPLGLYIVNFNWSKSAI